ncbi:efflux RND transporter periplasmic adaptor subunit [Legionella yabuuchiae]|uniref:efflux RND transporter periplasmic adaptor subunit n=1 Tax=Legionella yabuuchiae TaxID=376727 RepID=UPI001F5E4A42|nr:efflux RND transporter periplasmic adaptor subunit [Legionella yabuuchiae]
MKIDLKLNLMRAVFLILLMSLTSGCERHSISHEKTDKTYEVHLEALSKTLFFSGIIQPIREYSLTNPMDGVVASMPYHYGQQVKKNTTIFVLNSAELQRHYNDTLTEYLKAKDAYNIAKAKFIGTQDLWEAGLISKNNYLSEKSSLYNARVTLVQATKKLSEMVEKTGNGDNQRLCSLTLAEFDKVQQALSKKHDQIFLKARGHGVLLYPPKSADDKAGHLGVGSSVKAGQVLALIGDMSGIRVEIDVPEVDIDKIKVGMKANIRSVAYPNDELLGELVAVNAQASSNSAQTLPSFSAIVEVKTLSSSQIEWVKAGMSANIKLMAERANKLMVPIAAVKLKHGQRFVTVKSSTGQVQDVLVTTGAAEANKVVIESGLRVGDVVLYG